jgi:hypothetical protein
MPGRAEDLAKDALKSDDDRLRRAGVMAWINLKNGKIQPLIDAGMGFYRMLFERCFRSAFRFFKLPEYPDDRVNVHHWDLGWTATIRKTVRNIFLKHFELIEERTCVDTNCVFFILRKRPE